MNALEWLGWPQHFSHYKSMGIFRDTQGRLTPKFEFEMLWLSLLPVRVENKGARVVTRFSPLKPYGSYQLP